MEKIQETVSSQNGKMAAQAHYRHPPSREMDTQRSSTHAGQLLYSGGPPLIPPSGSCEVAGGCTHEMTSCARRRGTGTADSNFVTWGWHKQDTHPNSLSNRLSRSGNLLLVNDSWLKTHASARNRTREKSWIQNSNGRLNHHGRSVSSTTRMKGMFANQLRLSGACRSVQAAPSGGSASDRHEPVLCVVALVPTFLDRGTLLCALPSESVTTPPQPILPKKKGNHASVAGICLFRAPVT
jgi:hypothetical protein